MIINYKIIEVFYKILQNLRTPSLLILQSQHLKELSSYILAKFIHKHISLAIVKQSNQTLYKKSQNHHSQLMQVQAKIQKPKLMQIKQVSVLYPQFTSIQKQLLEQLTVNTIQSKKQKQRNKENLTNRLSPEQTQQIKLKSCKNKRLSTNFNSNFSNFRLSSFQKQKDAFTVFPQLNSNIKGSYSSNYLFNKDLQKLSRLFKQKNKTQQVYEVIDQTFCRLNLSFFLTIRNCLSKQEYYELIDKCGMINLSENRMISKKSVCDQFFFVLVDGNVSYNEERAASNVLIGQDQIQYNYIFTAEKGQILNSETMNAPKHNNYTLLSHSPATLITFPSGQTFVKLLKKPLVKLLEQRSYSLSHTSLFKGVSAPNIKKLLPYFFNKNFYKFNEIIYHQEDRSDFVYWILEGQVELVKEDIINQEDNRSNKKQELLNNKLINQTSSGNKQICKIVKLSKYEVFGIDQYVFKPQCRYLFTARVCSQSLKTICIPYKSLIYIQNQYPCFNENIDFYLKRASAMHSKILQKNYKIMENKQNVRAEPKKKRNKKHKKKKKNPTSMEWWGLAQNTVGNKKYKLQLPKFITNQSNSVTLQPSKSQPMFQTPNYHSSKIQQFRRKIFQQQIDQMIQDQQQRQKSLQCEDNHVQSPYKVDYIPKLNKLKVKMLDIRPKAIDNTQKVKKKLLSYAKNGSSFCQKLNLD